jgi:hypothetical protein
MGQPATKANFTPLGVETPKVTDFGAIQEIVIYNGPRVERAQYGQSGAPLAPDVLPEGRRSPRPRPSGATPAPAPAVEPEGSESKE